MSGLNSNRIRKTVIVLLLTGAIGIVAVPPTPVSAAEPQNKKEVVKAVAKLIVAAGAEGIKLSKESEDDLVSIVLEAIATVARDKLIDSALKDLMPD